MADVSIDSAVSTSHPHRGMRSVVFTTALIGYWFLVNSDGTFNYVKTTDGGASWGSVVQIDAATTTIAYDVWLDQWTPGDNGTLIHISWFDSTADDVYYRSLDTNGDSLGTRVVGVDASTAVAGRGAFCSITKARGGYLYIALDIDAGAERGMLRSTDSGANWATVTGAPEPWVEAAIDQVLMFPATGTGDDNDVLGVYQDASTDELTVKLWDSSAATDSESSVLMTMAEGTLDGNGQMGFSASIRHSDGHLIIAACSARDSATGDHRVFDVSGDMSSITELTAIVTDIDDHYHPAVFIDQTTNDIYVAYNGKRDGSEQIATGSEASKIYYTKSTDDGTSWSSGDTAYMEAAATNVTQVWAPLMGPRFYAGWRQANTTLMGSFVNSVDLSAPDTTATTSQAQTTAASATISADATASTAQAQSAAVVASTGTRQEVGRIGYGSVGYGMSPITVTLRTRQEVGRIGYGITPYGWGGYGGAAFPPATSATSATGDGSQLIRWRRRGRR